MSKKYLDSNNEAPKITLMQAFWTAATLKVFNAPEWLWGVFAALYVIGIIWALIKVFTYEKVEL